MAQTSRPVDPLLSNVPITDANGQPTTQFLRQWQNLVNLVQATNANAGELGTLQTQVAQNDTDIDTLFNRNLTAGVGLNGGGDLTADRTFDLANTAVSTGTYGDANNVGQFTVDQQGRITAAANIPIAGGGGGGEVSAWVRASSTFSSNATASKGCVVSFFRAVTISQLMAVVDATSGHDYIIGIYELDSSFEITSIVVETSTISPGVTDEVFLNQAVSASLSANTLYYFGCTRTDGASSFALPMRFTPDSGELVNFDSLPSIGYPGGASTAGIGGRIASNNPSVGQTVTTLIDAYHVGTVGSF